MDTNLTFSSLKTMRMLYRDLTVVFDGLAFAQSSLNGDHGLELILEEPFDLVLLDLMLPGLMGFEVLETMDSCICACHRFVGVK